MDAISKELHDFLVRLGGQPTSVSDRLTGYMGNLLHLLGAEDEALLCTAYGLFGAKKLAPHQLAAACRATEDEVQARLERCLRHIAITPEWQEIKALTKLKAIKLL